MSDETVAIGDWADAQRLVSREYFPHVLRPLRAGTRPDLQFRTVRLGPLTVAHIDWDADVSVATEHAGSYGINVPVSGHMESTLHGDRADVEPGHATIHPPDTPTMIRRWTADCANLGVKIDQEYLDRELARVFGRPGVRMPFQVDLTSPAGQGWLEFVRTMATQVRRNPEAYANRIAAEQIAGAITTMFALAALPEQADEGATDAPAHRQSGAGRGACGPGPAVDDRADGRGGRGQRAAAAGGLPRAPGNATP